MANINQRIPWELHERAKKLAHVRSRPGKKVLTGEIYADALREYFRNFDR